MKTSDLAEVLRELKTGYRAKRPDGAAERDAIAQLVLDNFSEIYRALTAAGWRDQVAQSIANAVGDEYESDEPMEPQMDRYARKVIDLAIDLDRSEEFTNAISARLLSHISI